MTSHSYKYEDFIDASKNLAKAIDELDRLMRFLIPFSKRPPKDVPQDEKHREVIRERSRTNNLKFLNATRKIFEWLVQATPVMVHFQDELDIVSDETYQAGYEHFANMHEFCHLRLCKFISFCIDFDARHHSNEVARIRISQMIRKGTELSILNRTLESKALIYHVEHVWDDFAEKHLKTLVSRDQGFQHIENAEQLLRIERGRFTKVFLLGVNNSNKQEFEIRNRANFVKYKNWKRLLKALPDSRTELRAGLIALIEMWEESETGKINIKQTLLQNQKDRGDDDETADSKAASLQSMINAEIRKLPDLPASE